MLPVFDSELNFMLEWLTKLPATQRACEFMEWQRFPSLPPRVFCFVRSGRGWRMLTSVEVLECGAWE